MKREPLPIDSPHLVPEWHPQLNGALTPDLVTAGSQRMVWWRCAEGHEWRATVRGRTGGRGCRICARRAGPPLPVELAAEWHPSRNGDLSPRHVTTGSRRSVWWLCANRHSWQARISNRVRGAGCRVCAGKTGRPIPTELAVEWHPTFNGDLTPDQVSFGSNRSVWWLCSNGHVWQAIVASRVRGNGCRQCPRRPQRRTPLEPKLVAQWHPTLNGGLAPDMVGARSSRKVWWRCSNGHDWRTAISTRKDGSGCPLCTRTYATGRSLPPELVAQWHPTRNGDWTPARVTTGSNKRFWWLCHEGHEWVSAVSNRTTGRGCPTCAGRMMLPLPAELVAQWHPTLNGDLTPDQVTTGSAKKVWWLCLNNHAWPAVVSVRANGSGCRSCPRPSGQHLSPELVTQWHPVLNGTLTPDLATTGSHKAVWWLCPNGHAWSAVVYGRVKGSGCPVCSTPGRRPHVRSGASTGSDAAPTSIAA